MELTRLLSEHKECLYKVKRIVQEWQEVSDSFTNCDLENEKILIQEMKNILRYAPERLERLKSVEKKEYIYEI